MTLAEDKKDSFDHGKFEAAAKHLHSKGAFSPDMMNDAPVRGLTAETFRVLSSAIPQDVPVELRTYLQENTFIFSGFKTYHELKEASALLQDDKGGFKSFEVFKRDITGIDNNYNKNYLNAEYKFAVQSSQMAVKWHEFEKDGDRYLLQYRTASDDKVRPEHAVLNGTTLPIDDPFWNSYLPPLDWGCRCTTVQVSRNKYPVSNSQEACAAGERATSLPKQKIFRFNPGKDKVVFPPKHPYFKLAKEEKKAVIEAIDGDMKRVRNMEEYNRLIEDENYTDVAFDKKSGGIMATHKDHNFVAEVGRYNISRGEYEKHAQKALFRAGYSVILQSEKQSMPGIKTPDGLLDGKVMDIKGVEGNPLYSINRANTQQVHTCILYYHEAKEFDIDYVRHQWNLFPTWLASVDYINDKTTHIKEVICVVRNKKGYQIVDITKTE